MDWIEFESGNYVAFDAMGNQIDGVDAGRQTEDGIELIVFAVSPEGEEFVMTPDEGVTFEPIRARMEIPGGMIEHIED